ncbi:hypothetical protein Z951_44690 [Streptomyces sp. PRh5]|nr:hypothetical protein Z951_44690 [Streptomyces sp. PRh5]
MVMALPDRRSRGEGWRVPMPTSTWVRRFQVFMVSAMAGSWDGRPRNSRLPTSAADGANTGRAPVSSARRLVSRVACSCTSGLPEPPTSWTTSRATDEVLARMTFTDSRSVALHDEMPMTSPFFTVASR